MRKTGPQAVTANRLADGAVVYLAEGGRWTAAVTEACLASSPDAAAALLDEAMRDTATRVVGPYLIEIELEGMAPRLASLKERIRAAGPTIELPV